MKLTVQVRTSRKEYKQVLKPSESQPALGRFHNSLTWSRRGRSFLRSQHAGEGHQPTTVQLPSFESDSTVLRFHANLQENVWALTTTTILFLWVQKPFSCIHTYIHTKHITIMSPYQALLPALDAFFAPKTPPSPCTTLDVQVSQLLLHCNQKDFQHKPVTLLKAAQNGMCFWSNYIVPSHQLPSPNSVGPWFTNSPTSGHPELGLLLLPRLLIE